MEAGLPHVAEKTLFHPTETMPRPRIIIHRNPHAHS